MQKLVRLVSQLCASQDNMARKPNSMPRKTTRQQRLASPTPRLARQQDNKTTTARKPKPTPRKTTRQQDNNGSQAQSKQLENRKRLISMAHKPNKCLARQHPSQDKTLANAKARKLKKDSSPWLTSQQCMPRKAK